MGEWTGNAVYSDVLKWIFVGVLAFAAYLTLETAFAPRVLSVTFLNVGNGDAILVESPSGATALIDAGPDASTLRALGQERPFWKRSFALLLTISSTTASAGAVSAVLARYRADHFYTANMLHRGMRFDLGDGVVLDVLLPSQKGNDAVLRIAYGRTSFFISSDLTDSERRELRTLDAKDGELKTNVLAVPHEGADGSVSREWLQVLKPQIAVISVGAQNKYGYPSATTTTELQNAGVQVFRTDVEGNVMFVSDGRRVVRK